MAEAIIGIIVKKLDSLITRKFGLFWGVDEEIKRLSRTLSTIQTVLLDAETQQITRKAVEDWLNKLKDVAYEADDILDEWMTDESLLQRPSSLSFTNKVQYYSSFFNVKRTKLCYKIAKKIKHIREHFDEIANERSFHLSEGQVVGGTVTPHPNQNRETSSVSNEPHIYGRDADKEKIVKQLLENINNGNGVFVFPILGIGGIGKTTLAQSIYNDERVRGHFNVKIWICVSDDFDVKRLSKAIIESVSGNCCDLDNLNAAQDRLRETLKGKKFLLVLDDVWNEKQDEWNKLKYSLTSGVEGSSIIITTRLQTTATIAGIASTYKLPLLSNDDCWLIFRSYAFGTENQGNSNLVEIGQEIVEKCGGVPLAAKALGSLLRFTNEENQWRLIRDSEIWDLQGGEETTILPALRLSYNYLSPHARQCFAYCSLFRKDYEMKKKDLIHLWMANDLIRTDERMEPEDVGDGIFNELLWHSMLQGTRSDDDGNIVKCKVHDLLHDLASSVLKNHSSKIKAIREISVNIPEKARHLSVILYNHCSSSYSNICINHIPHPSQQSLRTLMFIIQKYAAVQMHHYSNISDLTCLRTLDLRVAKFSMLPSSIGDLKHLRYLNVKSCGIQSLPKSICKLKNLQMLNLASNDLVILPPSIGDLESLRYLNLSWNRDITQLPESICSLKSLQKLKTSWCINLKVLPENTSNLHSLKHLDTRDCGALVRTPNGIGSLIGLQTLRNFIVSQERESDGSDIRELQGLNLLRGRLEIIGLAHVKSLEDAKGANLMSKPNLSELILNWTSNGDDVEWNSKEVLHGLQPHSNIKRLEISYYPGLEFPTWMQLGNPISSFPRLVKLKLSDLYNLEEWSLNWKENESLPVLQSLLLSSCKKLRSLPVELCNIRSLKSLRIVRCEGLISLPHELRRLTSLEYLEIRGCNHLRSLPEMGMQGPKSSLKALDIAYCKELTSLSKGLRYLTALESLKVVKCPKLKFSTQDLEHITALPECVKERLHR